MFYKKDAMRNCNHKGNMFLIAIPSTALDKGSLSIHSLYIKESSFQLKIFIFIHIIPNLHPHIKIAFYNF